MKPLVVVVGSYNLDLCWKCDDFPRRGETIVGTFKSGHGGKGTNQAVASARIGVPTMFVGAFGKDVFGDAAREFYKTEGIQAKLASKPGKPTGNAAILVDSHGQNEIVIALGANLALAKADIPIVAVRSARVVVSQFESNLATTAWTLREARKAGVTTVLNTAPWRDDVDAAMFKHVDVLVSNESETAGFLAKLVPDGPRTPDSIPVSTMPHADLHSLCRRSGMSTVIVTLGGNGCLVSEPSGYVHLPAHKVKVVDTTGAGDAFVGGFAGALAQGRSIVDAARIGNAVAALSVTRPGTSPSMPTRRELEAFLRKLPRNPAKGGQGAATAEAAAQPLAVVRSRTSVLANAS